MNVFISLPNHIHITTHKQKIEAIFADIKASCEGIAMFHSGKEGHKIAWKELMKDLDFYRGKYVVEDK